MEQTPGAEELMVSCYRCGQPILLGQGRYNVLPWASYCSWECLWQRLPQIAEAIARFVDEPSQTSRDGGKVWASR